MIARETVYASRAYADMIIISPRNTKHYTFYVLSDISSITNKTWSFSKMNAMRAVGVTVVGKETEVARY